MAPLALSPLIEFDGNKHKIDHVAQQYLTKASKAVQHFVPIETLGDGNCLFNSLVCLLANSCVSAVELRGLSDSQRSSRRSYATICAFFSKSERWLNSSQTASIIPLNTAILSVLWRMQFLERATTINTRNCTKSQHLPVLCSVKYTVFILTLIIVPKWRSWTVRTSQRWRPSPLVVGCSSFGQILWMKHQRKLVLTAVVSGVRIILCH